MSHSLLYLPGWVRKRSPNKDYKMNRSTKLARNQIPVIVLTFVLLIQHVTNGEGGTNGEYRAGMEIVSRISHEYPGIVSNNTSGLVVSLDIPSRYADDKSLRLISKIESIRNLKLFGKIGSGIAPTFTSQGISYLRNMRNLTNLGFACFSPMELPPEIMRNAANITQLQKVILYHAQPPAEEYHFITNMINLKSLEVIDCTKFGDEELWFVSNLPSLTGLTLIYTGVSSSGSNALNSMASITNFYFKAGTFKAGK